MYLRLLRALGICCLLSGLNQSGAFAQGTSTVPAPWSAQDIGGPSIAGDSSLSQGTFTTHASGADIWGQSDQFHYVYQQVTGDVDVIARVDSLAFTDEWVKAGVMIRSSLAANASHASLFVTGFERDRLPAAGPGWGLECNTTGPSARAPFWVRLVRTGTKVTASSSADGTTWSAIGSSTVDPRQHTRYVGLATTSHNTSAVTTAIGFAGRSVAPLSLPRLTAGRRYRVAGDQRARSHIGRVSIPTMPAGVGHLGFGRPVQLRLPGGHR